MNEVNWDKTVDILVVGSGAGAMTAALRAAHAGTNVLIVEKSAFYGGTSATSGGGLWIPVNHLMAACNIPDTRDEALQYMLALTGDDVPRDNVAAYVDNGARMLRWMEDNTHAKFEAMTYYADYYQHLPGAKPGGRSIDPLAFAAQELGEDFRNMRDPHPQTRVMGMMGYTNVEGTVLLSKLPGWFGLIVKLALRYFADVPWRFTSRKSRRLTMGNALIGRLRKSLMERQVPIWLSSPAEALIPGGDGRIIGAQVRRAGKPLRIRALRGVILGSGGFEHNQTLRETYLPQPSRTGWSAGNPANTGDMLIAGKAIGAATALMDEAWWSPTMTVDTEDRARALFTERSMPGAIVVNKEGRRFFNESVAYTTAVQAMYRPGNLPSYLIFDSRYKREYPFGPLLPGGMRLNWLQPTRIRNGLLKRSATIEGLAELLSIAPGGLAATVARFNGFAKAGKDEDFSRGENAYDLLYGDVRIKPNPCLAPLLEPPFYGIEIYPGDIGTKGGLKTNANAEVVNEAGKPIGGLYAVGNCAASVMGRYYPGAGATIGPAMTFGFVAAEHACRVNARSEPEAA
jgi:3-oxosteroid 1-dehydrogenase